MRVRRRQNGARWTQKNFTAYLENSTRAEASVGITRKLFEMQQTEEPVHTWPNVEADLTDEHKHFYLVKQIMDTDIPTVQEDDILEFVVNIMVWRNVRYVAVENHEHELVGLIASRMLIKQLKEGWNDDIIVRDIMVKDLITVLPETPTSEAIELMSDRKIGCLPVVRGTKLIGLVTERNIVNVTNLTKKFKHEW
jgi:CBS domain-containing protein